MTSSLTCRPVVSVVVPVYNGAATIGVCLRSLLALRREAFDLLRTVLDRLPTQLARWVPA